MVRMEWNHDGLRGQIQMMTKIASLITLILACGLARGQSSCRRRDRDRRQCRCSFLTSLNDSQRSKVLFDFNDAAQRVKWSNFPTGMVPRAGLKMGDLTDAQRKCRHGSAGRNAQQARV